MQGPLATGVVQKLTDIDLAPIKRYHFVDGLVSGAPARIARTGYTGEDGWEIYVAPEHAERLWNEILAAGAECRHHPLRPGRAQHVAPGIRHAALRP